MNGQSLKRRATKQLTQDNWADDDDDGGKETPDMESFMASKETMANRRILRVRRRAAPSAATAAARTPAPITGLFKGLDAAPAAAPAVAGGEDPLAALKRLGATAGTGEGAAEDAVEMKDETGAEWTCSCGNKNAGDAEACAKCWKSRKSVEAGDSEGKKDELQMFTFDALKAIENKSEDGSEKAAAPLFSFDPVPTTEQKKDEEKPAAAPVFSFGIPSATEQKKDDEKPAAAPVFSFGIAPATEQKEENKDSGKWKCPCCEAMNDDAKDACTECWAARPKEDKKTEEAKTAPAPAFSFGIAPTTQQMKDDEKPAAAPVFSFGIPSAEQKKDDEKPTATAMPAFSFGAAPSTEQKKEDDKPATAPVFSFGIPSAEEKKDEEKPAAAPVFSFGIAPAAEPKKEDNKDGKWKCPCCEAMNDDAKDACTECWVARPKEDKKTEDAKTAPAPAFSFGIAPTTEQMKDDEKPATAPVFSFGIPSAAEPKKEENKDSGKWKCPCCETMNDDAKDSCTECWAARPKNDSTDDAKPATSAPAFSFEVPSSTELKKDSKSGDGWQCPCCEALNDARATECAMCFVPAPSCPAPTPAHRPRPSATTTAPEPAPEPEATPAPPPPRRRRASFVLRTRNANDCCDVQSPARHIAPADAWRCPACNTRNSNADNCCSMCHVCRP